MRVFLRVTGLVLPGPTTLLAVWLADFWKVVIGTGVLAAFCLVIGLAVMAVSIRREERTQSLTYDTPGPAAAFTRRVLNVQIRTPDVIATRGRRGGLR
ncbi:hypothetical protein [Nonomuraea sp. bgisy101]|uniref:hypothetical protein n=1 Tax=Nonomuraea sp. bgisy101 TaxID=3413784 RepID=UPI003D7448C6